RGDLGYGGVVITDSLAMGGIADYSSAEIAVMAVNAGVDILLMPQDVDATVNAIVSAVENGDIPESRIDESVTRILRVKAAHGIITL
ncbi:MAG: glycoside hydrolase family 3 protein, partial [Eggerthellaceae bacterium]|nr:glycoside hydrolase family 3 protein [Eggerthellaceae bacterium]